MRWIVIILCLLCSPAWAASLAWDWTQSDGGLADGFKIHYGTASGAYTNTVDVGNVLTWPLPEAWSAGTYYFAASAYNAVGESGYSNEAVWIKSDTQPSIQPASGGSWQLVWIEGSPMTTVGPITASEDAQYGYTGNETFFDSGEGSDGVGWFGAATTNSYLQWCSISFILSAEIPEGATIDSTSKLEIYLSDSWSWDNGSGDIIVYGQKADNPDQPDAYNHRPGESGSPTTLTTAYATKLDYTYSAGWLTITGDGGNTIASIIQELVNDAGISLSNGDRINLFIRANVPASGDQALGFHFVENTYPAKLTIDYTATGGASAVPVMMRQYRARR